MRHVYFVFTLLVILQLASCEIQSKKKLKDLIIKLVREYLFGSSNNPSADQQLVDQQLEDQQLLSSVKKGVTGNCENAASWCGNLVKLYPSYCMQDDVKTQCKKACNLCSSSCGDTHPNCAQGLKWGYCNSEGPTKIFMMQYCKKSCGFCKGECGYPSMRHKSKQSDSMPPPAGAIVAAYSASSNAEPGKGFYPWQVAIYYDTVFICGGSLVDTKLIITAAHCFNSREKDINKITIVLGEHDRVWNEGTEQVMVVSKLTIHEDYDPGQDHHDIALISLTQRVLIDDYVSLICLPSENEVLKPGTECYLSGWGKTSHIGESVDKLQQTSVPIADRKLCKVRNAFNNHVVTDKMICAGYDNGANFVSSCHGDSGGPLQCEINGRWVLYGVVSWGSPLCNGLDRYTVFTRVSSYIKWIKNNR